MHWLSVPMVFYLPTRVLSDVYRVKNQISLHIYAVWSESSLGTFWKASDVKFLHEDNKDSNQTMLTGRLIWVFVGRTNFLKLQIICFLPCNLTMIGILMSSFSPASTIPWAMTSHLIIPPKMFTRIECTYKWKIYSKCPKISNPFISYFCFLCICFTKNRNLCLASTFWKAKMWLRKTVLAYYR